MAVPCAEPGDLPWLNQHAELAGRGTEYVRAGNREDHTWLTTVLIR